MIALYGPRNGRLIQARYDKSGVLKVRASPIYSFAEREKAPWDLFLRYHTSKPCDGPEIELGYDQVESEYVPIETESCRGIDVLAREPKHVPKNGLEPHQANNEISCRVDLAHGPRLSETACLSAAALNGRGALPYSFSCHYFQ